MSYEKTPIGKLTGFIAIEKPSTKFNEDGVYSCQVQFIGKDAKYMKNLIDEYMLQSKKENKAKKVADPPYELGDDKGSLIVRFKNKAVIHMKNGENINVHIRLYDSKNKEIKNGPINLGEGSSVIVAFKPYLWATKLNGAGCTLQLSMVQVIDLVEGEFGKSPFEDEGDDGYQAERDLNPFEDGPKIYEEENEVDF